MAAVSPRGCDRVLNKENKLVVAIIKRGLGTKVVAAAKDAGAKGSTTILGRGTAAKDAYEKFFNIQYQPEKELVLLAVPHDQVDAVLGAITQVAQLDKPGRGIGFILNLGDVHGIAHSLQMV